MTARIRYMGAKHHMAPEVASIIGGLHPGPCLDLFSGMCTVAGALAHYQRPAWANDVQAYAITVAGAVLTSQSAPPSDDQAIAMLFPLFRSNLELLATRFRSSLTEEANALSAPDPGTLKDLMESWPHAANSSVVADEVASVRNRGIATGPMRLATLTYSHGYFGLRQAIELDCLRSAIHHATSRGGINEDQARWFLVALLQAASTIATAPGHFAEYLKPNAKSYERVQRQRRRNVWRQFLVELNRLAPYGSATWRATNRVFRGDAAKVLYDLASADIRPAIVYADPPYSRAQYSRYYHVLETLTLYDYPPAVGRGRYRSNRFQTPFSQSGNVEGAFHQLAKLVAALGSDFVLSYPSNGLLYEVGGDPMRILRRYFRRVQIALSRPSQHSTLGASSGSAKNQIDEMVYIGIGG